MLAGMTAEVSVPAHEKENTLLIPNEAVSYHDGKPTVTVVNGTERRTVVFTMGIVSENITEVVSDNLHEGDLLYVSSISADSLRSLGLDPKDYLHAGQQNQQRREENGVYQKDKTPQPVMTVENTEKR